MTLYDFNGINLDERAQTVWKHGTFLTTRSAWGCRITLYHVGDFFAEVWHEPRHNHIVLVRGFKNKALLDAYTDQVDLVEIAEILN
ncbi:hypothetical protein [Pontibacter harenae]|uniref:hypothetical protein n=1 Tax=Pontibacter harenae TaxID=2894083 RepID=UPI001E2C63DB|nr:hypothetical protein [Pontibacter harenae]MCC9167538.1 hypothetical protein [Pontibacter harenae]